MFARVATRLFMVFMFAIYIAASASAQGVTSAETLTTTLSSLNLNNPVSDVDLNIKRGDFRFVGINGYTCIAAGVNQTDYQLVLRCGMRCLEGTSDLLESKKHVALTKKAYRYAKSYNAELIQRLHQQETCPVRTPAKQ